MRVGYLLLIVLFPGAFLGCLAQVAYTSAYTYMYIVYLLSIEHWSATNFFAVRST